MQFSFCRIVFWANHRWCRVFVVVPFFEIALGGDEAIGDERFDAHAGLRKTGFVFFAPVGLFHVFAEGEFDALRCGGEFQVFRARAIAQFDDAVLAADGIGGTVEQVAGGDAAGKLLIYIRGFRIDDVADADHCRARDGAFVDVAQNHAVIVAVDDARGDVFAFGVDDQLVAITVVIELSDFSNFAVTNEDGGVGQDAVFGAGPDGRMLNQNGWRICQRAATV